MGRVSESEFHAIVNDVAASIYGIVGVSIYGYSVVVTCRSGSGKSKWDAHVEFDAETGHYTGSRPYAGAGLPMLFADGVAAKIREAGY